MHLEERRSRNAKRISKTFLGTYMGQNHSVVVMTNSGILNVAEEDLINKTKTPLSNMFRHSKILNHAV